MMIVIIIKKNRMIKILKLKKYKKMNRKKKYSVTKIKIKIETEKKMNIQKKNIYNQIKNYKIIKILKKK